MMRWLPSELAPRAVLLLSLCLNAALVAYVAAQWRPPMGALGGMPLRLVDRVAERLPEQDAEVLRRLYRARQEELQSLQNDYTASLRRTLQVASQPTLDKPAFRAAVQEARDRRMRIGDAVIDTFENMVEEISPEGRRQMLKGLPR